MTKVLSFRTWCGIQEYFFFKQKEKSLDPQSSWGWQVTWSPIEDYGNESYYRFPQSLWMTKKESSMTVCVLSRMTNKNEYWDSSLTLRMKVTMDSRNRSEWHLPICYPAHSLSVIPHLMRNPGSISFFKIERNMNSR